MHDSPPNILIDRSSRALCKFVERPLAKNEVKQTQYINPHSQAHESVEELYDTNAIHDPQ